jgi:hypothetical protein
MAMDNMFMICAPSRVDAAWAARNGLFISTPQGIRLSDSDLTEALLASGCQSLAARRHLWRKDGSRMLALCL